MGAKGAVEIIFRERRSVKLAARETESEDKVRGRDPFVAVHVALRIDDVIQPHETRRRICRSLIDAAARATRRSTTLAQTQQHSFVSPQPKQEHVHQNPDRQPRGERLPARSSRPPRREMGIATVAVCSSRPSALHCRRSPTSPRVHRPGAEPWVVLVMDKGICGKNVQRLAGVLAARLAGFLKLPKIQKHHIFINPALSIPPCLSNQKLEEP
jgi:hypothetical protein